MRGRGGGVGHGCRLSRKATGSAARGCYVCLKLMEKEGSSRSSEPAVWRRGGVFPNAASGVQPLSTPPSDTAAAAPELKPLFSKRSVCGGGGGGGRGRAAGTEGARTSTLPLDTLYKNAVGVKSAKSTRPPAAIGYGSRLHFSKCGFIMMLNTHQVRNSNVCHRPLVERLGSGSASSTVSKNVSTMPSNAGSAAIPPQAPQNPTRHRQLAPIANLANLWNGKQ